MDTVNQSDLSIIIEKCACMHGHPVSAFTDSDQGLDKTSMQSLIASLRYQYSRSLYVEQATFSPTLAKLQVCFCVVVFWIST